MQASAEAKRVVWDDDDDLGAAKAAKIEDPVESTEDSPDSPSLL